MCRRSSHTGAIAVRPLQSTVNTSQRAAGRRSLLRASSLRRLISAFPHWVLGAAIAASVLVPTLVVRATQDVDTPRGPAPISAEPPASTLFLPLVSQLRREAICQGECCRFGVGVISGRADRRDILNYDTSRNKRTT